MFRIYGDKIISSDWHLFHTNILLYEFNNRKFLLENIKELSNIHSENELSVYFDNLKSKENKTKNEIIRDLEILDNIVNKATENLLAYALECLKNTDLDGIRYYFNLGDFLFNPNVGRLNKAQDKKYRIYIQDMYDIFRNKGIKSIFIRGNHDLPHGDVIIENYLKRYFNDILDFFIDGNIILTHVPIGGSLSRYKLGDYHKKIDEELMTIVGNNNFINIHGHTHGSDNDHPFNNVEYINCSMEKNL